MAEQKSTSADKVSNNSATSDEQHSYWDSARSPFASAIFVLPLIVIYEICVFRLPASEINNGAHQWANRLLMMAGIDDLIVPLLMFLILFLWQHWSRKSLNVTHQTLVGMWAESILFAMLLIGLGQAQQLAMIGRTSTEIEKINQSWNPVFLQVEEKSGEEKPVEEIHVPDKQSLAENNKEISDPITEVLQKEIVPTTKPVKKSMIAELEHPRERLISYLGAGIYEETFFRLLLIPLLYFCLKTLISFRSVSMLLALLLSSAIFALAHEVIPAANHPIADIPQIIINTLKDDPYQQFVFSFRALAGLYFGILFYVRGFGIAVGSHLIYDIFVGIMLK